MIVAFNIKILVTSVNNPYDHVMFWFASVYFKLRTATMREKTWIDAQSQEDGYYGYVEIIAINLWKLKKDGFWLHFLKTERCITTLDNECYCYVKAEES